MAAPPAPAASPPPVAPLPEFDFKPTVAIHLNDVDDGTMVVDRAVFTPWVLAVDDGRTFAIESPSVILGRRPTSTDLGVQTVSLTDEGRTISKTHARLELVNGTWQVTDLGSTNGVLVTGPDGAEMEIAPGAPVLVQGRLVLGQLGMRLVPGGTS
jgi:hypothetical protein